MTQYINVCRGSLPAGRLLVVADAVRKPCIHPTAPPEYLNLVTQLHVSLPNLKLNWYDWWTSHSVEAIAIKHNLKPTHANWVEAFPFTIVGDMPEGDKTPPSVPSAIMDAAAARQVYGDGSFGGLYRASEEIMHEIFNATLEDVLQALKFE